MTFERVRNGNPLELTVDQHFHTAHSISKLYNNKLKVEVEVFEVSSRKIFERNKREKIFCVKRNWDERAEKDICQILSLTFILRLIA